MGLRVSRAANSKLFIGDDIDPANMEETSDHTVWVKSVSVGRNKENSVLNIANRGGVIERLFEPEDEMTIAEGVRIKLKGSFEHWLKQPPFCVVCGRGDKRKTRAVPQARVEIEAPRSIGIYRDDIVETK